MIAIEGRTDELVKRILVIEDDLDMWPMIERAVRNLGNEVQLELVSDYTDAADSLRSDARYAVVLTDYLLADSVSGLHLRALCQEFQPKAAFAMMSAMPVRVPDLQSRLFLRKPYTISECERFLARLLGEGGEGPRLVPARGTLASEFPPGPA
jgi:DNA-binding NtrC family response regulator